MQIECGSCAIKPDANVGIGTLGFLLQDKTNLKQRYFITCAHVFAGSSIIEGGEVKDNNGVIVGKLIKLVDSNAGLGVDLAVGTVENSDIVASITNVGIPTGYGFNPMVNTEVFSYGAASKELRSSIIRSVSETERFTDGTIMPSQISCSPTFSRHGDSGAAVFTSNATLLGMIVGGNDTESIVTPIELILRVLNEKFNLNVEPITDWDRKVDLPNFQSSSKADWPTNAPIPGKVDITGSSYTNELSNEYLAIFNACNIHGKLLPDIKAIFNKVKAGRASYEQVQSFLKIPWFFIGFMHYRECNCDFNKHLHNGDPINKKTVHVPIGYPKQWNPPNDWQSSAMDALRLKEFDKVTDWSLPHLLYLTEKYNGFGVRFHNTASPYLWGYSDRYIKGGFPRDHEWNSEYLSKQCGLGTLLKYMMESNLIAIDSNYHIEFKF